MILILFLFRCLKQIYNEQIGDLLDPTQRNLEACICHPFVLQQYHLIKHYLLIHLFFITACSYVWSKLLQMKDDNKNALYIENLTEEYVTSYDDVTQILIKVVAKQIYC